MADDSAGQFEQSLVDVGTFFVTHAQAPKVMEPGECALDDPAGLAQSAAVGHTSLGQQRLDPTPLQLIAMGLRIVTAITLHGLGTLSRTTGLAMNARHRFKQGQ